MTRKKVTTNKGHNYNSTTSLNTEQSEIADKPQKREGNKQDKKKVASTDSPSSSVTLDNGQIAEYNKFVQEAQDWYFEAFKKDPKDRTIFERYSVKLIENEIALRIDGQYRIYLLTKNTTNYHETKT